MPGIKTQDIFVPRFKIFIDKKELDPLDSGYVSNVTVNDSVSEMDTFSFTLSNWDPKNPKKIGFKFIDTDKFGIGKDVEIQMGYREDSRLTTMIKGIVTSWNINYPQGSPPSLVVSGHDYTYMLKNDKKTSRTYRNKKDSEIADEIYDRLKKKLPGKLYDKKIDDSNYKNRYLLQRSSDLAFLHERAGKIGFEFYIKNGTLYFMNPADIKPPTESEKRDIYSLSWGKNLISFTPRLNINDQVTEVTVKGWDVNRKRVIKETANRKDLATVESNGKLGTDFVQKNKKAVITTQPVESREQAKQLAVAALRRYLYGFLTGKAKTFGLPDLICGKYVKLNGLGNRFSGFYYITGTTHTIDDRGYTTGFDVRKSDLKSLKKKNQ